VQSNSNEAAMDVVRSILDYNAGRDPERLAIKYRLMRANPFAFYRATCHLFYQRCLDLPLPIPILATGPVTWVCGDLHLENFGGYQADDGRIHFDLNDFEEATLAPCTLDLVRLLASIFVAAPCVGLDPAKAGALCEQFLRAYTQALCAGKARSVGPGTAAGVVKHLLEKLRDRKRVQFLDQRSTLRDGQRRLTLDGQKALPATPGQRAQLTRFMERYAREHGAFFTLLDVARRISGNSSLGLERYVLLVEGTGSPDCNYLFDLKRAIASAVPPALAPACKRPNWNSDAERIVDIARRMQSGTPAFLDPVMMGDRPYVLRELQPGADKIAIDGWDQKAGKLDKLLETMGQVLAWDQLRSSGHAMAASRAQMIGFGLDRSWRAPLLDAARASAQQAERDSGVYASAYDDGAFKPH
jgi:uncharacterized protein (DUF2252 family)